MTDLPPSDVSVPARLGVTARLVDGRLVLDLAPRPEVLHQGVVRASVLAFVIDALAGVTVDDDPSVWTLTTDLSLRMLPVPAPECITATGVLLKRGRKAATSRVDLTAPDGTLVAMGAAGFTTVPRRESDPVKPVIDLERLVKIFGIHPGLSHPLRDEAGIDVIDAATGVVELAVRPEVRNPNGTLQGAMVALIAEAAVEDLLTARHGEPFVVTDLDVRYLGRAENGPVRSSCRVLGDAVEVTLTDTSTGGITTLVYARAARSSL